MNKEKNTKLWKADLLTKLGSFAKIVPLRVNELLHLFPLLNFCFTALDVPALAEEMTLNENDTGAVAMGELTKAKEELVKKFKSVEKLAKAEDAPGGAYEEEMKKVFL